MSLTWHDKEAELEGLTIGRLAIICPLLERMDVAGIINRHLPADPRADYDHGKVLTLLTAARLCNPVALVNVRTWAVESGADILWNMDEEKINDDRFGRSLDAFFTQRHSILAALALHVSREFGVSLSEVHYDPTHILLHGIYEDSAPRALLPAGTEAASDDDLPPAHITRGRPLQDVPSGSRIVHAGICTAVDAFGPLPFFGHTIDGNQNGRTGIAEQLALIRKHLQPPALTMISDRGTFSVQHLIRLAEYGYYAICSAPWNEFRPLFDEQHTQLAWKQASFLSIEQRRRRGKSRLPREHYEVAEVPHDLIDHETGKKISCRVIFVYSTADEKIARQQRQKAIAKIRAGLELLALRVSQGQLRTDPTSIARRVAKLFGNRAASQYFRYEMVPLTPEQQTASPPPKRGCRRATHRLVFRYDEQAARRDELYDGISVLVSTAPAVQTADELFTKFKQQSYSEHAHHIFKRPLAVHPVYLKTPARVEALVFLMMIALTLYFLLQRLYRQTVPEGAPAREQRTTTKTIFRAFSNYSLLISSIPAGRIVRSSRLSTRQRQILQQLAFTTPAQILSQRLPRAP